MSSHDYWVVPVKIQVDPATISHQTDKGLLSLFGPKEEDYRKGRGENEGEGGRKRGRNDEEEASEDQEKPTDQKKVKTLARFRELQMMRKGISIRKTSETESSPSIARKCQLLTRPRKN